MNKTKKKKIERFFKEYPNIVLNICEEKVELVPSQVVKDIVDKLNEIIETLNKLK